jgi:ABC-type phosphate transport system substrate-binding protein
VAPTAELISLLAKARQVRLPFSRSRYCAVKSPIPSWGKSNTHALLEVIAHDPSAIGYGTLDANPDVRAVAIKSGLTSLAIEPTISNIRARKYPITRQVYWATNPNAPLEAKEFCAWVLSPEGQLVVEGAGFEPLLPEDRSSGLARLGIKAPPAPMASSR